MRYMLLAVLFACAAISQTPGENPQLSSSQAFFDQVKGTILKSAEKMPEDKYSYRPTDEVRTYGQLLSHIADGQFFICGIVKEGKGQPRGIEKNAKTKADIVRV